GSIVDVFPSTSDAPVRVDLWGDEVDRLTEFSVADQRSTGDVGVVELYPCRELLPTDEVRARAERLVAGEPWGREQWERLAEGLTFDGMESWLPWLTEREHLVLDLVPDDAQVLLIEPRRMRDRAGELLDEEASLAGTLAQTWGAATDREWPRLHLPFDRLLAHTDAPAWTVAPAPEGPDTAVVNATGWDPVVGDGSRLVHRLRELLAEGYRVVVATDGARYGGMVKRSIGGVERDYLLLEYKGGDKLYVPSDQIDAVRHYTGGETPTVNRLGGSDWERTKSRMRSAVREIAQELVVLYQKRVTSSGIAFGPDWPLQRELAATVT